MAKAARDINKAPHTPQAQNSDTKSQPTGSVELRARARSSACSGSQAVEIKRFAAFGQRIFDESVEFQMPALIVESVHALACVPESPTPPRLSNSTEETRRAVLGGPQATSGKRPSERSRPLLPRSSGALTK